MKVYNDDIGEVLYVSHMGSDSTPAHSARVSLYQLSSSSRLQMTDRDAKLIQYLADHHHTSPFEHCALTVQIKCPLFVRSQIMRHRTFSYNEVSRRYTSDYIEFWRPQQLRKQHDKRLQCSTNESIEYQERWLELWDQHHRNCLDLYNAQIEQGMAREQARAVLPQSLYTQFWMSGNLNNWAKFLKLRLDPHSQPETKVIADAIRYILHKHFPISSAALLGDLAYVKEH